MRNTILYYIIYTVSCSQQFEKNSNLCLGETNQQPLQPQVTTQGDFRIMAHWISLYFLKLSWIQQNKTTSREQQIINCDVFASCFAFVMKPSKMFICDILKCSVMVAQIGKVIKLGSSHKLCILNLANITHHKLGHSRPSKGLFTANLFRF